ncbi:MAG: hypothetical protein IT370_19190 [Deltaproteobacteria bacterium]|nr:hypothetical protein [Deltaproteobacteria bacterium]
MTTRIVALGVLLAGSAGAAAKGVPVSFARPASDGTRTAKQKVGETAKAWLTAVAAKDGKALAALFPEGGQKYAAYQQQGPGTLDAKSAKKCGKLFRTTSRKAYAAGPQACLFEADFVAAAAAALKSGGSYREGFSDIETDFPARGVAPASLADLGLFASFAVLPNMGALKRYHVILAIAEESTGKYPQGAVLGVFAVADDLSTYHKPSDDDAREAARKFIAAMAGGDVAEVKALLRPATDFFYAQHLPTEDKQLGKVCNKAKTTTKATELAALAGCLFEPRLRAIVANPPAVLDAYDPDGWRVLKNDAYVGKKNADLFMKTTEYVFVDDLSGEGGSAELLLVVTTHPTHGTVVIGVFGKVVLDG